MTRRSITPTLASLQMTALVAAPLLLAPGLALATQVDRNAVTLGALARNADRIALVQVTHVSEAEVLARVERDVVGAPDGFVAIPRAETSDLSFRTGEQLLVFLREDDWGDLLPLQSRWHAIPTPNARVADLLVEATRSRLPQLGDTPGARRMALFLQLEVAHPRIQEDAALDLLAYRELAATPLELQSLRRALERAPGQAIPALTLALLDVALRVPRAELYPALLEAARTVSERAAQGAACQALRAIDRAAAVEAIAADLRAPGSKQPDVAEVEGAEQELEDAEKALEQEAGGEVVTRVGQREPGQDAPAEQVAALERAVRAAHLLGLLGGREAAGILAKLLEDERPVLRRAAIPSLGASDDPKSAVQALEALVWRHEDADAARRALAALALANAGRTLVRLAKEHPEDAVRQLAERLRADPSELARTVLWAE